MNLASHGGLPKIGNLVVINNIFGHNGFGWRGDGTSSGVPTLDGHTTSWIYESNAIYSARSSYPPNNFLPTNLAAIGFVNPAAGDYRLSNSSPLKGAGAGGVDLGASIGSIPAPTGGR